MIQNREGSPMLEDSRSGPSLGDGGAPTPGLPIPRARPMAIALATLQAIGFAFAAEAAQPSPVPAADTVLVAPPTGDREPDRTTILAALEGVEPGGTVLFAPGTYLIGDFHRVDVPRVTLLGHPDGTAIRGCDPDAYPEYEVQLAECNGLELAAADLTVRGLTIEHAWHGVFVGCCFEDVMASARGEGNGPPRDQPGGEAGERMDDGVLSAQPPPASEPSDRYIYDPGNPVPSSSGSLGRTANAPEPGAYDQSDLERRDDVLVYTTPPLDDPLDVIGPLRATLYVSSSAPDTDFTVKLVDVHPDGRAFNVQEGILRARYREGFDRTVWMRPGEVYEVEVDLHVTAHRFLAGHRVRVEVSSSNFPRFDRNLNTGGDNVTETEWRVAENAIHHSPEHPSSLLLRVVAADGPEPGERP